MPSILWNGQLLDSDTPVVRPDSLTVRYGIGVFETMRCYKGTLLFVEDHIERLTRALHALSIPVEPVYNQTDLTEQARNLMHHHTLESGRIRLSVLSNGDNPPDYLMSCAPLPAPESQPLHIDFSSHFGVMASPVSFFKNINYQHYLLAADEAKQRGLDDVILLNQHQRICETSISNIFCRIGNVILTPSIEEGCVAGIFRKQVLNALRGHPYEVHETQISADYLMNAEEIFLTNVIRGIRVVGTVGTKTKDNTLAHQLKQHFSALYPD